MLVVTTLWYMFRLSNMEKHIEIQLFEFEEVGTNLFHLTILSLTRFLIEIDDSENNFQIINVIDALSILMEKFLYDTMEKND